MVGFIESQLRESTLALPTSRSEAWRYTSLKALERRALAVGDADAASRAVPAALLDAACGDAPRIVFVNGVMRADLSTACDAAGLSLEPAGAGRRARPARSDTHASDVRDETLARDALDVRDEARARDALEILNEALARDTLVVRVAPGRRIARPLHVVHVGAPAASDLAWYGHCAFELGDDSALELVEHHVATGAQSNVGNLRTDVSIGSRATLRWTRLQRASEGETRFTSLHATLGADAKLEHYALDAGGALVRHRLVVVLGARGASLRARGVFALRGRQHADTQLEVVHDARDTHCDIAYRGLADERARGVFAGSIVMRPGADGADARLENKNLLLSPHAEIDTKPVLEIHADEVKASHGATVGQIDERALFYLRSRGLPEPEARAMLTYAFCASMFDAMPGAGRAQALALLSARLGRSADGATGSR